MGAAGRGWAGHGNARLGAAKRGKAGQGNYLLGEQNGS